VVPGQQLVPFFINKIPKREAKAKEKEEEEES